MYGLGSAMADRVVGALVLFFFGGCVGGIALWELGWWIYRHVHWAVS